MFEVNILIFLLSRTLEESHRTLKSYALVYLNLTQEEKDGSLRDRKSRRGRGKRPKNFKIFYCHLSYPVVVGVLKGSRFTSQVCCRT